MKKLFEYLLVILLLSPLLCINIRSTQDWGDDYAAYLREAKNISEGKPFYQSRFEYHNYNIAYAPPYYSYGFPLLLSPVVKTCGLDFSALNFYMSLWAVAWALLIFYFLRHNFSFFISLSFTLIFFLNPFFFDFKTGVISDIPFSFFFLLSFLLYQQRKDKPLYYYLFAGLIIAFTIGMRGMGIILLPVIAFEWMLKCIQFISKIIPIDEIKKETRETAAVLVSAIVFILLLGHFIFRSPVDLTHHFLQLFISHQYWDVVLKNLDIYTIQFSYLFHHDVGKYSFSIQYTAAFMLVFLVIGILNTIFSKHRSELFFLVSYCAVIMLYPVYTQGFRFLFPVLPFLIFCIIRGAGSINTSIVYNRSFLLFIFLLFILMQYKKEVYALRESQQVPERGPFTEDNRKALDYIKTNINDTALIASLKPRAVELFTSKRTCVLPSGIDIPLIADHLKEAKPVYILCINDLGPLAENVARYRKDSLVWQNNACKLYLCNNHQNKN